MDYREFPVPPALHRHVQCAWRLVAPPSAFTAQTIYPDGRCELIVHLGPPPGCWHPEEGWHPQSATLFAAQRVTAVRLACSEPIECVGLRLRPAASALIAGPRLRALRDRIVDLSDLDAPWALKLRRAASRFASGDADSWWALLEDRCARFPIDERMEAAVTRLDQGGGRSRIEAVARAAHMSLRGFQSRFHGAIGLPPKEYARLVRLQSVLRALDTEHVNVAEIAANTGFADQAHATRELRRTIGVTPARLGAALRRDRQGDSAIRLAAAFVRGAAR